jgi:transposase
MPTSPVSRKLRPLCHIYYVHRLLCWKRPGPHISQHQAYMLHSKMTASRNRLDSLMVMYIIRLTHMRRAETSKPSRMKDVKADMLRRQGALHPNPEAVQDEAFRQEEFFDPRDLVQVRYEMLRRHQVDRDSVTEVATAFGVSRQAYYVTEAAFEKQGLPGLLPRRRGPRRAHKCTEEVLDFVEQQRAEGSPDQEVSEAVRKRFGISIHPRSLVRALTRQKKKQR